MRSHPVVGLLFLLAGFGLLVAGAFAPVGDLPRSPLPKEVIVPFILWQLAAWCLLLGAFFMRKRRLTRPAAVLRPAR